MGFNCEVDPQFPLFSTEVWYSSSFMEAKIIHLFSVCMQSRKLQKLLQIYIDVSLDVS